LQDIFKCKVLAVESTILVEDDLTE